MHSGHTGSDHGLRSRPEITASYHGLRSLTVDGEARDAVNAGVQLLLGRRLAHRVQLRLLEGRGRQVFM